MTVDYPDSDAIPNYRELIDFEGSGIVVIGAGQGMGRQTCHALAQCGATVLCVDREADLAKAIAAEVKGIGCPGDATVRRDVEAVFDMASKEFGPRLSRAWLILSALLTFGVFRRSMTPHGKLNSTLSYATPTWPYRSARRC
jgi:NAD(P)-dependent dehydrogenase (short-subunit alcohol dehydrogenase family)